MLAAVALSGCTGWSAAPTPGPAPSPSPGPTPTSPGPVLPPAPAGEHSTRDGSAARELREIELERLEHLVAGDVARAAPLHADDFEVVPPPGGPMGRDQFLTAVESGELDFLVWKPISDIEVRVHGTAAVLWYESRIAVVVATVELLEHDTWHLYYYENRDGAWQVVREQATAVDGFPPPPTR
ncbi:hypothetical protein GCM10009809_10830 [Isoptericola hypogeus]|uniref:DUF4440 domain-containing protein n=1 Tax=Isoptericola hypogeus TaxID=300179 RepID=A0ABN2J2C5_9MICO